MRSILFFVLGMFLLSLVSANVIITSGPDSSYNLGDVVSFKTKVFADSNSEGFYTIKLSCGSHSSEVHKEYLILNSGSEKSFDSKIPLSNAISGGSAGSCSIQADFLSSSITSETFVLSDKLKLELVDYSKLVKPSTGLFVSGKVLRENGSPASGFVEIKVNSDKPFKATEIFKDGFFSIESDVPRDFPSGIYNVGVLVYEKDNNGAMTNNAEASFELEVLQVPTNLEIILDSSTVIPGEVLSYFVYLRDQTGKNIPSKGLIKIGKGNQVLYQSSFDTSIKSFYEVPSNEPPAVFELYAEASGLSVSRKFNVPEHKLLGVEIVDSTLIVTNKGNVPYNENIEIMIGSQKFVFPVSLNLYETKKYQLSAPDGEYEVKVLTGANDYTGSVFLTGNAISAKEVSEMAFTLMRHPIVWIFIILLFGVFGYILFRRSSKRSFFTFITKKVKSKEAEKVVESKNDLVKKSNKADLVLSIQGDKQESSFVVLKIKNHKNLSYGSSSSLESLQKIVEHAESKKAYVYESPGELMFMFVPSKTKTFKNEIGAFELAEVIKESLEHHNKMFKDAISYGLSVSSGTIVAKDEKGVLKFMALGSFLPSAKKIASVSSGEILMGSLMKDKVATDVKYEKKVLSGVEVYELKELKNRSKHDKFLKGFVKRMEGKN